MGMKICQLSFAFDRVHRMRLASIQRSATSWRYGTWGKPISASTSAKQITHSVCRTGTLRWWEVPWSLRSRTKATSHRQRAKRCRGRPSRSRQSSTTNSSSEKFPPETRISGRAEHSCGISWRFLPTERQDRFTRRATSSTASRRARCTRWWSRRAISTVRVKTAKSCASRHRAKVKQRDKNSADIKNSDFNLKIAQQLFKFPPRSRHHQYFINGIQWIRYPQWPRSAQQRAVHFALQLGRPTDRHEHFVFNQHCHISATVNITKKTVRRPGQANEMASTQNEQQNKMKKLLKAKQNYIFLTPNGPERAPDGRANETSRF